MLGAERRVDDRKKQLENKLPNLPTKESEKNALEYVSMVYEGYDKVEAFKLMFPERYKNSEDFAHAQKRDVRAMVMASIAKYESGKYVSKLYSLGRDEYWKRWIHKKTRALEKTYDMAMNDEETPKTQLSALKLFMENVPDMKEEQVINVKHHMGSDKDFLSKLESRKNALLNSVDIEDAEIL